MTLAERVVRLEERVERVCSDFRSLHERQQWLWRSVVTVVLGAGISFAVNRIGR